MIPFVVMGLDDRGRGSLDVPVPDYLVLLGDVYTVDHQAQKAADAYNLVRVPKLIKAAT